MFGVAPVKKRHEGKKIIGEKPTHVLGATFIPVHLYEDEDAFAARPDVKIGSKHQTAGSFCNKCKRDRPHRCPHRRLYNPASGDAAQSDNKELRTIPEYVVPPTSHD